MISASKHRARQLRIIAAVVLVLGIFGADLVYWLGSRSAVGASDDPQMLTNEKAAERQAEILIGKQAGLVQGWVETLKHPGPQAILVVVAAVLVAGACFYFAGLIESNGEAADESHSPKP
jgi:flagellar basal body-associated protein FliL